MNIKNLIGIEEYTSLKSPAARESEIPDYIWQAYGIDRPHREYQFLENRRYRIDYAWPDYKLAVEIEGGFRSGEVVRCHICESVVHRLCSDGVYRVVRQGGAHVGSRYESDLEKYNALAAAGWTLLRYLPGAPNYLQISNVLTSLKLDRRYDYNSK